MNANLEVKLLDKVQPSKNNLTQEKDNLSGHGQAYNKGINFVYETEARKIEEYREETARAVGVSTITIRRRIQSGELRAMRTHAGRGGRVRILKRDVARLLTEMVR